MTYSYSKSKLCKQIQISSKCRCQQLYVLDKRPLTDLCAPLAICFQIDNSRVRCSCNLKGSNSMGDGRIFSKISSSLFNDDLSNEPYFSRIHFAGQYLPTPNFKFGQKTSLKSFSDRNKKIEAKIRFGTYLALNGPSPRQNGPSPRQYGPSPRQYGPSSRQNNISAAGVRYLGVVFNVYKKY